MDYDTTIFLMLALCVALSFLFSGMESGVMALSRLRIRQAARAGDGRASLLLKFLNSPEDFLWTILVGNTMANFLIFSLGLLELQSVLRGHRFLRIIVSLAGVFVFYIVCELLPKTLFRRYPDKLSMFLARPFRFIHAALSPLVAVVAWFARGLLRWTGGQVFTGRLFGNREELRLMMQESAPSLTTEEKAMINRVLDLQNLRVRHVMAPMEKAVTILADSPVSQALAACREKNLSRLPVVDPASQRVQGVLDMEGTIYREDLDPSRKASDYMRPAMFLHHNLPLEDAMHRMQRGGARLAVVLDENHKEIGLVSLQDILRAIFGEVTL